MNIVYKSTTTPLSKIDIEEIMRHIETNDYLRGKTADSICEDIANALHRVPQERKERFCKKLLGYRLIENMCDIRAGRFTRWISLDGSDDTPILQSGGMAINIKIEDDVQIVCKTFGRRGFVTCRFNNSIVFQKLSEEESLILLANEYLQRI